MRKFFSNLAVLLFLIVLLGCFLSSCMLGQVIGIQPTPLGLYSWDTTTNVWDQVPNSSTANPYYITPQAFALYGYNAALGQWTPCTTAEQCGLGAGTGCTLAGAAGYLVLSTSDGCTNSVADYGVTSSGTFTFPRSFAQNGATAAFAETGDFSVASTGETSLSSTGGFTIADTSTGGLQIDESGTGPLELSAAGNIETSSAGITELDSGGNFSIYPGGNMLISPTGSITLDTADLVLSGISSGTCAYSLAINSGGDVITQGCGSSGGVTSINSTAGAFTFNFSSGAGSCSGTTCTFTGSGSGGGSVTDFIANSGSWPSWLVPTVTDATTTPTLAVAASAIPNSALANASITINSTPCTLGGSCTISGGGGGVSGSGTTGYYALWTGSTALGNGHLDDGVTTASTITSSEPITVNTGSGQGGTFKATEGTAATAASGVDILYADSTNHCLEYSANGGSFACLGAGGGGMVYPSAGIANSTGTAWATSYTVGNSGSDIPQLSSGLLAASILPLGSSSAFGAVKVDGTTITASGGVISAVGGGGGAVSSVSNSDGSLTISPTTGAVVASLNLAHSNTFTASQTAPGWVASGTTAGFADFAQGSDSSGVAPCNTANSICWEAPASVTAYVGKWPAAQPATNNNYVYCTAANPTVCSFAQPLWSQLGNATANLTLANAGYTTEFDQTSAATWTWANTTAAINGTNQYSPIWKLCGQAWEGSGTLTNQQDCWTIQNVLNGNNPNPTLTFTDSTNSTGAPSVTLGNANFFYNPNTHSSNIGGSLSPISGNYDIAVGEYALLGGGGSADVMIGYEAGTNLSGSGGEGNNTAFGYTAMSGSCTGCVGNVAIGSGAGVSPGSEYGIAIGYSAGAGAYTAAIAIGVNATVAGNYDINIGYNNTLAGANDVIIGEGITATAANQVILGNSSITTTTIQGVQLPGTIYSAAGTALPSCASGLKGGMAVVSDATSPAYMAAYTSGGGITTEVICSYNGTSYSWLTH